MNHQKNMISIGSKVIATNGSGKVIDINHNSPEGIQYGVLLDGHHGVEWFDKNNIEYDNKNDKTPLFLKVNGSTFVCECGCNIFHKPNPSEEPNLYQCNVCEILLESY